MGKIKTNPFILEMTAKVTAIGKKRKDNDDDEC
jgi:hypothetical protein